MSERDREFEILSDTLTRCQQQCTKLLLEKRELEDRVKKLQEYTLAAQETAFNYGIKLQEVQEQLFDMRAQMLSRHTAIGVQ